MRLKPIASNMTEVTLGRMVVLFSYETPVACSITGEGWYKTEKKWSATTSRHVSKWLDGVNASAKPQEWFDSLASNVRTDCASGPKEVFIVRRDNGAEIDVFLDEANAEKWAEHIDAEVETENTLDASLPALLESCEHA